MKTFIVGNGDTTLGEIYERKSDCIVVEVPSKEHALAIYAAKRGAVDSNFVDYMHDHAVNMSFAEYFWLTTDRENLAFTNNGGEVLTSVPTFERRVRKFFGEHGAWAELYIKAWRESKNESFALFPPEMVLFAYTKTWLKDVVAMEVSA